MSKEQEKNACDWLENLEGDAWTDACEEIAGAVKRQEESAQGDLWAVHAKGPDDLYAAFSREDAEKHAAELNALPMPEGIAVSAVVVASPWPAAEHWKYLAEQEREHNGTLVAQAGQVPAGYALIPTRLLLDKELIESIAFHCGDGGGSYGDYQDGILFIGEITDDDGRQVHGLHLACAECEEEGYTTLVEFAAAPAQGGE